MLSGDEASMLSGDEASLRSFQRLKKFNLDLNWSGSKLVPEEILAGTISKIQIEMELF
jgi:hypothetical protein